MVGGRNGSSGPTDAPPRRSEALCDGVSLDRPRARRRGAYRSADPRPAKKNIELQIPYSNMAGPRHAAPGVLLLHGRWEATLGWRLALRGGVFSCPPAFRLSRPYLSGGACLIASGSPHRRALTMFF